MAEFTSSSALTITTMKKDPRADFIENDTLTSASGTVYFSKKVGEFLSLGVYKDGAPVSVALSNDVNTDGDLTALNYREDPDHDPTSILDYLKSDTRGITAGRVKRLTDTITTPTKIRLIEYKDAK